MFNTNTNKIAAFAVGLVVLLSAVGIGAAATTDLVGSDVNPTNSTESIYVDVTGVADMNGSGPVSVTVALEGLASDQSVGNGTQLSSSTLSVSQGATESFSYQLADTDTDYDRIHVSADVADGSSSLVSADFGTLERMSGGGGGLLDGGGVSIPVIGALVIGGYFLVGRD